MTAIPNDPFQTPTDLMALGHGETVYVKRYRQGGGRDPYNRPIEGYGDPEPIEGAGFDLTASADTPSGVTEKAQVDALLLVPAGLRFDSRDRFVVRGETYRIQGVPEYLTNFFTGLNFRTEIWLRRVNG